MSRPDKYEEERIAEAIKSLAEYTARKDEEKRLKVEQRKESWTKYYEQLGRGNSNIGTGAKRRMRAKISRLW